MPKPITNLENKWFDHAWIYPRLKFHDHSGSLIWVDHPTAPHLNGTEVGWISNGYRYVNILGTRIKVCDLIFFLKTKRWPHPVLNHINNNGLDNSWKNLKEETVQGNNLKRKIRRNDPSIPQGVKLVKYVDGTVVYRTHAKLNNINH